jgi:hypothetical protein
MTSPMQGLEEMECTAQIGLGLSFEGMTHLNPFSD